MGCCSKSEERAPGETDPTKNRSCTDIPCCLFFIVFLGGMGYVGYLGFLYGDPHRILYGVDSWGNACNKENTPITNVTYSGEDTTGLTKLFYFDPTSVTPGVVKVTASSSPMLCVKQCPNETLLFTSDLREFHQETGSSLCRYGIPPQDFGNGSDPGTVTCPSLPVIPHIDILNKCVPKAAVEVGKSMLSSVTKTLETSMDALAKGQCDASVSWMKRVTNDLLLTWREMAYSAAVSVPVSMVLVFMMRFFAKVFIWIMVVGSALGSVAATGWCWYQWYVFYSALGAIATEEQTEEDQKLVQDWLIYAGVASGAMIIIILILLIMRKRIALVVQLFSEAGQACGKMPCILFQPLWTLIILLGALAGVSYGWLYVFSAGHPEIDPQTGFVAYVNDDYLFYLKWYFLFGILWLIQFVIACQDMVVAGAVAGWYFTRDKAAINCCTSTFIVKSLWRLVRYHLGTVAFGSFIIAFIQLSRIILGYIQRKLHGKTAKIATYIMKCLQCCLYLFEKLMKYINRNAYIMTAIHGYSFCEGAKRAFALLLTNILRVGAINSVGKFTLFLGQVAIVAVCVVISMQLVQPESVCYFWVPLVAVGLFAMFVAYCFLDIYGMAIDTIFLCFCEDCERNDGDGRPFFMGKGLMKYIDDSAKKEAALQQLTGKPVKTSLSPRGNENNLNNQQDYEETPMLQPPAPSPKHSPRQSPKQSPKSPNRSPAASGKSPSPRVAKPKGKTKQTTTTKHGAKRNQVEW